MSKKKLTTTPDLDLEPEQDPAAIEAETPEQQDGTPAWEFRPRQNPKWGTVTREGLIVGRGASQRVIPPDEVYHLASLGCSMAEMARWFGVSESTLNYNFREYVDKGNEHLRQRLRAAQIKLALSGTSAAMLIFLGKAILGQRDNPIDTDTTQVLPWQDD